MSCLNAWKWSLGAPLRISQALKRVIESHFDLKQVLLSP